MSWKRRFDDPIALEDGTMLRTLRDAINYLGTAVPKAEHDHPAVTAATIITQVAEGRDQIMHARIATLQAINRHKERVFTDRKTIIGARGG